MVSQRRFFFVDALRGIAALSVVLFHAIAAGHVAEFISSLPYPIVFVLRHGEFGVAIFFVLSGFVIAHSLYQERVTIPLVARFMLRRSIRLDPSYWMAIAVALAFSALSAKIIAGKVSDFSYGQLVAHFLYLQDILGFREINDVFWTLCLEVQFYFIYCLILAAGRNDPGVPLQGTCTIAMLSAACVISVLWPTGAITSGLWQGSFLPLWHAFLIGSAAYWTWKNAVLIPYFVLLCVVIGAFAIIRGEYFSIVSVITAGSLWIAAVTRKIYSALASRWLQGLGAISYSLYLIHNPITGASFRVGFILTGRNVMLEAVWWLVSIIACLVAATIFWLLVERPSMRLAKFISLSPQPSPHLRKSK